jgi:hypothetical protein
LSDKEKGEENLCRAAFFRGNRSREQMLAAMRLTRVGRVPTEAVGKAELSELRSLFFLA